MSMTRTSKTYVVDLDGTVCQPNLEYPDTHRRYALAVPIMDTILFLRRAEQRGDRIILHTARRMLTHKGDVAKIEQDVGQITRDWLRDNNVPYHELVFGKPYGDYYIDDKAVKPWELEQL